MKYYWDAFIDELSAGKIEDRRAVEGQELLLPFVAQAGDCSQRDLCRLFCAWLEKKGALK